MQRPTGVTILAVLAAVGGVLDLLGGIAGFFASLFGGFFLSLIGASAIGLGAGVLGVFWSLIVIATGAVSLGVAYGAWYLKPWAWLMGMIISGVGLFVALVNLIDGKGFGGFLFSVIIYGGILYYLYTPEIRRVFGRV